MPNIYYEPVNTKQWNIFDKVTHVGHIEPFLATKQMKVGDLVLLHVGTQDKKYEPGIYAYGTIVSNPYIFTKRTTDYCYNKLSADVRIDKISYIKPLIAFKDFKEFNKQFRTVHIISNCYYAEIYKILEL